jgi:L-serine dehydratase
MPRSGCGRWSAFGANKAVNAASLALRGDGMHRVSFDEVVETMRQTGADMNTKYKETSRGGLAVNMAQC